MPNFQSAFAHWHSAPYLIADSRQDHLTKWAIIDRLTVMVVPAFGKWVSSLIRVSFMIEGDGAWRKSLNDTAKKMIQAAIWKFNLNCSCFLIESFSWNTNFDKFRLLCYNVYYWIYVFKLCYVYSNWMPHKQNDFL